MQLLVKKYLLKASLLAGLSLLLGLVLSFMVYRANEQVKTQTVDVVKNRLPILAAINELIADLSEQERIVYEYYRSKEQDIFLASSESIQNTFTMHLNALKNQQSIAKETQQITSQQHEIIELFRQFDQQMDVIDPDWDQLRVILATISDKRINMLPTLKRIENMTTEQVDSGHKLTLEQIDKTALLVGLYSIFIIATAIIVAWYIRRYILTQTKSTRLAHFAQRNPNPIISVNNLGEVLFANPACKQLLQQEGLAENNVAALIPDNFVSLKQVISKSDNHHCVIEQTLKNKILQVSINWLQEFDCYDIHIKDVTEQVLAQQEVKQLAFTSQETGLPNQYKLQEKLNSLTKHGAKFALGVVSIRQFNEKVATLGGEAITSLIRCAAKTINKNLPSAVTLFHVGEGEFVLLCMDCTEEEPLKALADTITTHTDKALVTRYGEFFIECDFGFVLHPLHASDSNSLLKNAHIALSIASQNTHENYCFFTPEFAVQAETKAALIDSLRNAITLDELFLVYQPQLSLHSHKVTGIETLVRWRHNQQIVSPVEFIPLAEQSGLIVPIGQWILREACLLADKLIKQGITDIIVAVNVSPRQFSHPLFIETVEQALKDSGINPCHLELEITEGVFMHNEENTLSMMQSLKKLGVQLSIDDFGTGYSSLSYLKQFPIDKLKIDQSFVRDCHNNNEDKAIIKTIIALGKSLGLKLIAEGVEEKTHVDILSSLHCDEIQGYWYSRPLEEDKLLAFFSEQTHAVEALSKANQG
ncbi:sensor domain-containing protein [Thalassotalea sediminis]|uniref:sensor domain-containing protein n=1 Tax=Thalassotalea sediminis TaxID=1759089 RepID=UPI00257271B6|nr:GGDEF domain-containing phosphodiesterase [Thalassotalea sediminis]